MGKAKTRMSYFIAEARKRLVPMYPIIAKVTIGRMPVLICIGYDLKIVGLRPLRITKADSRLIEALLVTLIETNRIWLGQITGEILSTNRILIFKPEQKKGKNGFRIKVRMAKLR
jgi:hypothetical protein